MILEYIALFLSGWVVSVMFRTLRNKLEEEKFSKISQTRLERRQELYDRISAELNRAYSKHGSEPWSRHEFYGILKEEVDELWDDIKKDSPLEIMLKELTQVAAMCFRYYETRE